VGVVCNGGFVAVGEVRSGVGAEPVITAEFVYDYPARYAVCVRPLMRQVTDRETADGRVDSRRERRREPGR